MSKKPVLIIGTILPVNFQFLNFSKIALSIQDMESLDELVCLQKPVRIHLKINTGMNRQGVDPAHVSKYIAKIKKNPHIQLEGVFSHLADADNSDNSYTQKQITIFDTVVENIIKLGLTPRYCHLSATSGSLKVKSSHINAIRLGLGLYGYNPLTNTDTQFKQLSELTPALNFYSHFTKIRSIKKGQKVSYNCTFESKKDGKIGVIPVGYYEGFDCRLSNAGFIKHVDNFYPVAGRVCMNLSVIDLTNTINPSLKKSSIKQNSSFNTPSAFDKVQIISSNSDDKNSVKNIAQICNTIDYEILVKLSESIRRTIVD